MGEPFSTHLKRNFYDTFSTAIKQKLETRNIEWNTIFFKVIKQKYRRNMYKIEMNGATKCIPGSGSVRSLLWLQKSVEQHSIMKDVLFSFEVRQLRGSRSARSYFLVLQLSPQ